VKNKAAKKAKTKAKPPQVMPVQPRTREAVRDSINRKLLTFLGMHKRCSAPVCKRVRRCADPGYRCGRDVPQPPMTAAEGSAAIFRLRKALDADIARRKALGEWPDG
jgi:hypothetical protein